MPFWILEWILLQRNELLEVELVELVELLVVFGTDNGSSFNIPITIKFIALTNITIIETSVVALYLLLDYLIFNPPLLCYAPLPGDSKFV